MDKQRVILTSYFITFICTVLFVLCMSKSPLSQSGSQNNLWGTPAMWLSIILVFVVFILMTVLKVILEDANGLHSVLKIIGLLVTTSIGVVVGMHALNHSYDVLGFGILILTAIIFFSDILALIMMFKREKRHSYSSYSSYR